MYSLLRNWFSLAHFCSHRSFTLLTICFGIIRHSPPCTSFTVLLLMQYTSSHSSGIFQPQPLEIPLPNTQQRLPYIHQSLQLLTNFPFTLQTQLLGMLQSSELAEKDRSIGHLGQRCRKDFAEGPSVIGGEVSVVCFESCIFWMLRRTSSTVTRGNSQRSIQILLKLQTPPNPQQSNSRTRILQHTPLPMNATPPLLLQQHFQMSTFLRITLVQSFCLVQIGFQIFGD
mmetsp:Transcript_22419/g.48748  ORF Transcript_22419/g.48748 Transcript_22419/m.48748 type:complete len:228 (+) Transcript_22419:133-816(+)